MHKRTFTLFAFILTFSLTFAQNWQPLNSSETFNFREGISDVISASIWVDSMTISGTDTLFHLNRIMKQLDNCSTLTAGSVCDTCCFTSNGWNFLQREFSLDSNGVAHFYDPADFYLHTLAGLNDSFVFDSLSNDTATVTALDTGRVLGQLDSLKTFTLSSGGTLVLSQSYGLVSMNGFTLSGIEGRDLGELTPDFWDIFDFQIGDRFQTEYRHSAGGQPWELESHFHQTKFVIDSFQIYGDTLMAFASGVDRDYWTSGYTSNVILTPNFQDTIIMIDSVNHFSNAHVNELIEVNSRLKDYFFDEVPLLDRSLINPIYDRVSFSRDPQGRIVKSIQNQPFRETLEPYPANPEIFVQSPYGGAPITQSYASGIGLIVYDWFLFEAWGDFELVAYAKAGGDTVGVFTADSVLLNRDIEQTLSLQVWPNPASHQLTLQAGEHLSGNVTLWDLQGRAILETSWEGTLLSLDLQKVPEGLYLLAVESREGRYYRRIQITR